MIRINNVTYSMVMQDLFKTCGHINVRKDNGFVLCNDCSTILPNEEYKEFYNYSRFFDSDSIYLGGKFIGKLLAFLVHNVKNVSIRPTSFNFGHTVCIELEDNVFLYASEKMPYHKQISWLSVQVYLWLTKDNGVEEKSLRKFFNVK